MLQVLLSLVLAMAAFHRWLPSTQATHSHLQDTHVSCHHVLRSRRPIKLHLYSLKLFNWRGRGCVEPVAMVKAWHGDECTYIRILAGSYLRSISKLSQKENFFDFEYLFPFFIHNPTLLNPFFVFVFSQQSSTGFQLVHTTFMFYSALSLISLSPHLQTIFTTLVNAHPTVTIILSTLLY